MRVDHVSQPPGIVVAEQLVELRERIASGPASEDDFAAELPDGARRRQVDVIDELLVCAVPGASLPCRLVPDLEVINAEGLETKCRLCCCFKTMCYKLLVQVSFFF